jgi:hypothetical protein
MPRISPQTVSTPAKPAEIQFPKDRLNGEILPLVLSTAVPLWIYQFMGLTNEERIEKVRQINDDDFCVEMEYVLHRGSKKGQSAKAFNKLAQSIALLSFCPGGVRAFGSLWEAPQQDDSVEFGRMLKDLLAGMIDIMERKKGQ